jgi:hypothetical protein
MNPSSKKAVPLPSDEQPIAPVTILDAQGRVVRVVSAEEFRRRRLVATAEIRDEGRSLVSTPVRRAPRRAPTRVPDRSLAS